MSLFNNEQQRDDMYGLARNGVEIDDTTLEGRRLGRLDRPHIFAGDGNGEILPASLLRAKNKKVVTRFKGKTFKMGEIHSHDENHSYHILEDISNPSQDLINKFKGQVQNFRNKRRQSRDR